jgi:Ca2+-binding EF-hand superfamily protein
MSQSTMGQFLFRLFDVDQSGVIAVPEFLYLVSFIWNFRAALDNDRLQTALKIIEGLSGNITEKEFQMHAAMHPILLAPVMKMQITMREKSLGNNKDLC